MNTFDIYRLSRLLRNCITLAEIAKGYNNHERRNEQISIIRDIIEHSTETLHPTPSESEVDLLRLLLSVLYVAIDIPNHTIVRHRLNFFISVCHDQLEMLKHRENNPVLDDNQIRYFRWADPSILEPKKEEKDTIPVTTPDTYPPHSPPENTHWEYIGQIFPGDNGWYLVSNYVPTDRKPSILHQRETSNPDGYDLPVARFKIGDHIVFNRDVFSNMLDILSDNPNLLQVAYKTKGIIHSIDKHELKSRNHIVDLGASYVVCDPNWLSLDTDYYPITDTSDDIPF